MLKIGFFDLCQMQRIFWLKFTQIVQQCNYICRIWNPMRLLCLFRTLGDFPFEFPGLHSVQLSTYFTDMIYYFQCWIWIRYLKWIPQSEAVHFSHWNKRYCYEEKCRQFRWYVPVAILLFHQCSIYVWNIYFKIKLGSLTVNKSSTHWRWQVIDTDKITHKIPAQLNAKFHWPLYRWIRFFISFFSG